MAYTPATLRALDPALAHACCAALAIANPSQWAADHTSVDASRRVVAVEPHSDGFEIHAGPLSAHCRSAVLETEWG